MDREHELQASGYEKVAVFFEEGREITVFRKPIIGIDDEKLYDYQSSIRIV